MAFEKCVEYFEKLGLADRIKVFDGSSATVAEAAQVNGTTEGEICKTLSFKTPEGECILIECRGDAKIDNRKFKDQFHFKAKMLTAEEVVDFTGHAIGGVCAFAIEREDVTAYTDISLKEYEYVYPAVGSANSAIKLTPDELHEYSHAKEWIDVCKLPEE